MKIKFILDSEKIISQNTHIPKSVLYAYNVNSIIFENGKFYLSDKDGSHDMSNLSDILSRIEIIEDTENF